MKEPVIKVILYSFQFLGIPPKGERTGLNRPCAGGYSFQFLGIPPKGELHNPSQLSSNHLQFPIPRDPPEGGTATKVLPVCTPERGFPIPRDPPEGGTRG